MCKQTPVFCSNGDTDIENRLMDTGAGKEREWDVWRERKFKKKKDTCILSSPSFQSDIPGNIHIN